jgi:outer membrane protein insertion porin family
VISSYSQVRYPGGRFALVYTLEQQFPIVHPLHGVLFFDAGNTWDDWKEIKPWDLKLSTGIGFRLEIPLLGNVGFDYAYGFQREEFDSKTGITRRRPGFKGHFLLGNINF